MARNYNLYGRLVQQIRTKIIQFVLVSEYQVLNKLAILDGTRLYATYPKSYPQHIREILIGKLCKLLFLLNYKEYL